MKQRSESKKLSYREGILAYTVHIESGRKLMGDIVCQRDSGASIVGACFTPREAAFRDIYVCGRLEDDWDFG